MKGGFGRPRSAAVRPAFGCRIGASAQVHWFTAAWFRTGVQPHRHDHGDEHGQVVEQVELRAGDELLEDAGRNRGPEQVLTRIAWP